MPDQELRRAYESARYVVETAPGEVVLRVGEASPLAGAFLTACNPRSVRLSPAENAARQAELVREVRRRGYAFLPARGESAGGAAGSWPAEASLLIPEMGRQEALDLARAFGQAAILYAELGRPVEIIWA